MTQHTNNENIGTYLERDFPAFQKQTINYARYTFHTSATSAY